MTQAEGPFETSLVLSSQGTGLVLRFINSITSLAHGFVCIPEGDQFE